jgi:hypothetical protein
VARKVFEVTNYYLGLQQKIPVSFDGIEFELQGSIFCVGAPSPPRPRLFVFGLHPSSPVTPEPDYVVPNDIGAIFVPFNDLHNYVDIVRNEKPVFAILDSDNPNSMGLVTSVEPVGEEEAASDTATRP